jgi:hypothetical protein
LVYIFCGHLAYFMVIWYIFFLFWYICCTMKNLVALVRMWLLQFFLMNFIYKCTYVHGTQSCHAIKRIFTCFSHYHPIKNCDFCFASCLAFHQLKYLQTRGANYNK